MVRSAAKLRVSNPWDARPAFETPRKRAAPQDGGYFCSAAAATFDSAWLNS
jgi:hypothetical protein